MSSQESPTEEERAFANLATIYAHNVMASFNSAQDRREVDQLPVDMQVEAFIVGTMRGLFEVCFQVVPKEQHDGIVATIAEHVSDAADNARESLKSLPPPDKK